MVPSNTRVIIKGKINIRDYKISRVELDPKNTGETLDPRDSRNNGFNLGFDFKY